MAAMAGPNGMVPSVTSLGGGAALANVPLATPTAPPGRRGGTPVIGKPRPPPPGRSGGGQRSGASAAMSIGAPPPRPPPAKTPLANKPVPPGGAPPSPVLTDAQKRSDTIALLNAVYTKYAPEKLSEVGRITAKFAGREAEIVAVLKRKYGAGNVMKVQLDVANTRKRLRAVYAQCDPTARDVEEMLNSFAGSETILLDGLRKRFGDAMVNAALRTVRVRTAPTAPTAPTAFAPAPPLLAPAPTAAPAALTVDDLGHEAVLLAVYESLMPSKVAAVPALAKKFAKASTSKIVAVLERKYGVDAIQSIVEGLLRPPAPAAAPPAPLADEWATPPPLEEEANEGPPPFVPLGAPREFVVMYRYISCESCSQFDSLPRTHL